MRSRLLLLLLLTGCSSEPLTPDEIAWRRQVARENWALCEAIYAKFDTPTIHRGHIHRRGRETPIWAVRRDLMDNRCRQIMGPYWAT